ncbi:MAG TPA: penicillin-binding protein 2 [Firmicutes bacterium]|nr:penicillin-binding protein 2 [Bacillota bacterium]
MEVRNTEKRLFVLFAIILLCTFILVGRLWFLQLARGEHYARLADGNRMRQLRLLPPRGEIADRNGQVLVRSKPAFTVSVVPGGYLQEDEESLCLLCEVLGLTPEELAEALEKGKGFPYEPVRIKQDVQPETVVAIEENRMNLPGIFIEEEPVREYLYGELASHVVGYMGIITASELQRYGTTYRGSDLVGKSGIEQTYEELLRGETGTLTVEVNALNRPIRTVNVLEPVPGHNITLTIDAHLQEVAERAFYEHILNLEDNPGTQTGAILVLNPQTGEILVMASMPGFEPKNLIDQSQRNAYYTSLSNDSRRPFFNRVTQALFGPGSTFKPITALTILEEGVMSATERFNATGTSQYGVKDWVINSGLAPFGMIDMYGAMGMSSNHYFADNGAKVGIDRISEWMRKLGFGKTTGLDLFPGEVSGIVPSREWKRQAFSDRATSEQNWYPSDTEQISIGQGFHQMTLIQLAQAYAAIANKGTVFAPQIVKEIEAPDGTVIFRAQPEISHTVEASQATWDALSSVLTAPITHSRGTARGVMAGFPYSMAGKTGTWEVPGRISNGLYVGYAPVENPEVLVAVVVEQGGGGSSAAAPIARKIFDAYFGLDVPLE